MTGLRRVPRRTPGLWRPVLLPARSVRESPLLRGLGLVSTERCPPVVPLPCLRTVDKGTDTRLGPGAQAVVGAAPWDVE